MKKFSISIPNNLVDWHLTLENLNNLSDYFNGIEIPACNLGNQKLSEFLLQSSYNITNVTEIIPISVSRNIIEQNISIRENIFNHINSLLLKEYSFPVNNYTIDLGLDNFNAAKSTYDKIHFLKQFSYSMYLNKLILTIPTRIPNSYSLGKHAKYMLDIITQTMVNGFKICLNIYPHESTSDTPDKIFKWFDFDLNIVRIIYEPETGNYITKELLNYWFEPLDKIGFTGNIIFCPKTNILSLFEDEMIKLSKVINQLSL